MNLERKGEKKKKKRKREMVDKLERNVPPPNQEKK